MIRDSVHRLKIDMWPCTLVNTAHHSWCDHLAVLKACSTCLPPPLASSWHWSQDAGTSHINISLCMALSMVIAIGSSISPSAAAHQLYLADLFLLQQYESTTRTGHCWWPWSLFCCASMVLSQGWSFLLYSLPLIVFLCPPCPAEDKPPGEAEDPWSATPQGQAFPRKLGGKGWEKMDSDVWTGFQMEPRMLIRIGNWGLFWSCKSGSKATLEVSGGLGLLALKWEVHKTSAQPPPLGMCYQELGEAIVHFMEGITDLGWGTHGVALPASSPLQRMHLSECCCTAKSWKESWKSVWCQRNIRPSSVNEKLTSIWTKVIQHNVLTSKAWGDREVQYTQVTPKVMHPTYYHGN